MPIQYGYDNDSAIWVCSDCEHEHRNVHGFCECGCTYPGEKKVG